jgi:site-specific DNA recombinase
MKHRAVIYTRVSTEEQASTGTSLESQIAACLAKAESLGARVVATHEDAGVSGAYYATRPGLQSALAMIDEGRVDTLIVANVSRLSRDGEHQAAIAKRVRRAGGRIVFCEQSFEESPEGELSFGIFGQFAQYERQVIRSRTMKGRRKRAEEGI